MRMNRWVARLLALLLAVAAPAAYATGASCGVVSHVASCCGKDCPHRSASSDAGLCCQMDPAPAIPAPSETGVSTQLVALPVASGAWMLPRADVRRNADAERSFAAHLPAFLEFLTLRL
jgi:hypothetical protein